MADENASDRPFVPVDATSPSGDPYSLDSLGAMDAGFLVARDGVDGAPMLKRSALGRFEPRNWRFSVLDDPDPLGRNDRRLEVQLISDADGSMLAGYGVYGQPEFYDTRNRSTRVADDSGRVALLSSLARVVPAHDDRYALSLETIGPATVGFANSIPFIGGGAFTEKPDVGDEPRERGLKPRTFTPFGESFDEVFWSASAIERVEDYFATVEPRQLVELGQPGESVPRDLDRPTGYVYGPGIRILDDGSTTRTRDQAVERYGPAKIGLLSSVLWPEASRDYFFETQEGTKVGPCPIRGSALFAFGPVDPVKGARFLAPLAIDPFWDAAPLRTHTPQGDVTVFAGTMVHDSSWNLFVDARASGATGGLRPVVGVNAEIGAGDENRPGYDPGGGGGGGGGKERPPKPPDPCLKVADLESSIRNPVAGASEASGQASAAEAVAQQIQDVIDAMTDEEFALCFPNDPPKPPPKPPPGGAGDGSAQGVGEDPKPPPPRGPGPGDKNTTPPVAEPSSQSRDDSAAAAAGGGCCPHEAEVRSGGSTSKDSATGETLASSTVQPGVGHPAVQHFGDAIVVAGSSIPGGVAIIAATPPKRDHVVGRLGDWTLANADVPIFGEPGSPRTLQGAVQYLGMQLGATRAVLNALTGGPAALEANLAAVARNRTGPPAGHTLAVHWKSPEGGELRTGRNHTPLTVRQTLHAPAGTRVVNTGGVVEIIREHLGSGVVDDRGPLILLENSERTDRQVEASLIAEWNRRFEVDYQSGVRGAAVEALHVPGETRDVLVAGVLEPETHRVAQAYLKVDATGAVSIADPTTPTAVVTFDTSALSENTTQTLAFPDASGTIALVSGGAGGTGKPTANNWGKDSSVLIGDVALTDTSSVMRFCDADGTDRVITLPPVTGDSPMFPVFNMSADGDLIVETSDGETIEVLEPGWSGLFWPDEYLCQTIQFFGPVFTRDLLTWGMGMTGAGAYGRYMWNNYWSTSSTGTAVPGIASEITMTTEGAIDTLGAISLTGGTPVLKILKNGAVDQSISVAMTANVFQFYTAFSGGMARTAVAVGDEVAIEYDAGDASDNTGVQLGVAHSVAQGLSLDWGADWSVGGSILYGIAGDSAGNSISASANYTSEHTLPFAASTTYYAWQTSSGDATTVMALYKNGALDETITLDGAVGALATGGTSYAIGDEVATAWYNQGTNPGTGADWVNFSASGTALSFAGDPGAAGEFFTGSLYATVAATTAGNEYFSERLVPLLGRATRLSWNTESGAGGASTLKLWKNGAVDQSITRAATAAGTVALTETVYPAGSEVALEYDAGTDPNDGTYLVYFR